MTRSEKSARPGSFSNASRARRSKSVAWFLGFLGCRDGVLNFIPSLLAYWSATRIETTTGTCSRCLKSWFGTMKSILLANQLRVAEAIPVICRSLLRKASSSWRLFRLCMIQKLIPEAIANIRGHPPHQFAREFYVAEHALTLLETLYLPAAAVIALRPGVTGATLVFRSILNCSTKLRS